MKLLIAATTFVAIGLAAAIARDNSESVSLQGEQPTKVISRKGVPITALGRGDEREIVVEKDQPPPLEVKPPKGTGVLEWLTAVTDAALTVSIVEIHPSLTDDNEWITSTVVAKVVDVLKNFPESGLATGAEIRFTQEGGELTIAGRRVRAVLDWADEFKPRKTYLVFVTKGDQPGEILVGPTSSFEVGAASKLTSLLKSKRTVTPEVGLDDALRRVRAASGQ